VRALDAEAFEEAADSYQTIILGEILKYGKQIIIEGRDCVHNPGVSRLVHPGKGRSVLRKLR
jgi:hypothetical protein